MFDNEHELNLFLPLKEDNEHPLVFEGTGGSLVVISYMYSCNHAQHPLILTMTAAGSQD